jgi:hypothetical protein
MEIGIIIRHLCYRSTNIITLQVLLPLSVFVKLLHVCVGKCAGIGMLDLTSLWTNDWCMMGNGDQDKVRTFTQTPATSVYTTTVPEINAQGRDYWIIPTVAPCCVAVDEPGPGDEHNVKTSQKVVSLSVFNQSKCCGTADQLDVDVPRGAFNYGLIGLEGHAYIIGPLISWALVDFHV